MRKALLFSFATVALAAPTRFSEWGRSLTRLGSWFGGAIDPQLVFGSDAETYDDSRTIYKMLKDSNEFTKLMEWVDMSDEIVDRLKTHKDITFFAVNNDALQHDMGGGHHGDGKNRDKYKEVIRQSLLYNILPGYFEWNELGVNSTLATELHAEDGSFGNRRRRVKMESTTLPPAVTINNFVKVVATYKAKNGIVHVVNHPIFPPPDIMDAMYLFPQMFSTSATAYLKTDLEDELEFNSGNSKNNKHGDQWPFPGRHGDTKDKSGFAATTVFVPTNDAWNKLPADLVAFLFSPFGESTLRKLMQYHTIPDYVLYTEWIQQIKTDDNNKGSTRGQYASLGGQDDYELHIKKDFPTLLKNQQLPIQIDKTKSSIPGIGGYYWNFKVHGVDVANKDNPAQNGAIHVINSVLCPRHHEATDSGKDESDWSEWQKWLIDWARDD